MKLLMVLPRFPFPLEKGDQLRAYHQIKELSAHYQVHLFCICGEKDVPANYIKEIEPFCVSICIAPVNGLLVRLWQLIKMFFKKRPLQCAYFYSGSAKKRFDKYFDSVAPDILLCQLIRVFPYVEDKKVFKVLDYQDVFSYGMYKRYQVDRGLKRCVWKYEYKALKKIEKEAFGIFDITTIISEQDRMYLPIEAYEREKVKIWRNGVDTDYFKPNAVGIKTDTVERKAEGSFDIVFTGNMGYSPNEDAAEFLVHMVLPELNKAIGTEASVLIAGTSPTYIVRSLASEKVNVTGWIRDIRKAYACGKVFVAPMRLGTGMQNKLLEAMACGCPCIASEIAVKGLGLFENCPVIPISLSFEEDRVPHELIENIVLLLGDKDKREALGRKGREFVVEHYTWSAQAELFTQWM